MPITERIRGAVAVLLGRDRGLIDNASADDSSVPDDDFGRRQEELLTRLESTLDRRASGSIAPEAYEGLRRQVARAARDRVAMGQQLITFASAVDSGADADALSAYVEQWLLEAGIRRVVDAEGHAAFFDGPANATKVLAPAWVESVDGQDVLLRPGRTGATLTSGIVAP